MDILSDRVFDCPCCGEKLKVNIGVKVIEATAFSDVPAPKGTRMPRTAIDAMNEAAAAAESDSASNPVVIAAMNNGMLAAFEVAVERAFQDKPKDIAKVCVILAWDRRQ